MVALAVYAFDHNGASGVGVVTAARLLPATIATPFIAGLIDRGDRQLVVLVSSVLAGLCLLATGFAMARSGSIWLPAVLSGAVGVLAVAPRPALQALLPALAATPAELTVATAAWSAVDSTGFLIGGGLGGIALGVVGTATLVELSASGVLLAALLVARLPRVSAIAALEDSGEGMPDLAGLLAGVRVLRATAALWIPFGLLAGLLALEGATDVQLVALAIGRLHMGGSGPGVLFTAWGVGGVLAGAVTLSLVRRRGYGLVLLGGALLVGAALAVSGLDGVALAVVAMAPVGLGFAMVETAVMAVVPRLVDDAVIGRVYGLSELLYSGAVGVGGVLGPVLVELLGTVDSLLFVGGLYGAAALLTHGFCARLDSGEAEASRVRELLRGVRFLAPLPLPALERLVRAARSQTFESGAEVIRAGDEGNDFYVVEHGAAVIVDSGRQLETGSAFGEIALLRDIPRTTTIHAADALGVQVLSRRAFLAAVGGSSDARAAADTVIDEYLTRDPS